MILEIFELVKDVRQLGPIIESGNEDASQLLVVDSWGEQEMAREIELLEAHLLEGETAARFYEVSLVSLRHSLYALEELHLQKGKDQLPGWLHSCSLDYIFEKIQQSGRRLISRVFTWLLIKRIRQLQADLRSLVRLMSTSDMACLSYPLFAYGPELSEYRHRFR